MASAAIFCAAAPACAQPPPPAPAWTRHADPLERLNRGLYAIHRVLETVIIGPVLYVFSSLAPQPLQHGLRNAVRNIGEPATAVNDLLQLHVGKAANAAGRFVTNSTLGLLGLFDVARDHGLPYHATDFGQTLQHYGVPTGPYLFVPVVGPSSVRDAGARFVNGAIDPVGHFRYDGDGTVGLGRTVVSTADTESQALANKRPADPYAALRTAYLESRSTAREVRYARSVDPASDPERPPATFATASWAGPADPMEAERQQQFASVSATFFRPAP